MTAEHERVRTGKMPRVGHRRAPVVITPGLEAPVRAEDLAEEQAARAALAEAKRRLTNATARLNRQLGTAEFGTIGGRRVVQRRELVTGGDYAPVNHRALLEPYDPEAGP
jgi:hypothetical protein